ncbi:hypothetical protein Tco_0459792 [Tanacetum coccineum]
MGITEGERGFEQIKEFYLTKVIPFFKTLKEHFKGIQKALTKEIKEIKEIFEELESEVDQNVINRKHDKIERKNLLIANDNLIIDCLSKEVFYIATNSELTYQNLKESCGNNTSPPARDAPDFDSVFRDNKKIKLSILRKTNAIKKLRMQISQLKETRGEANRTLDFKTLDFQITQLTDKVTVLQEQNELFRAENAKIKKHYKELYDSIKITYGKHIEQTTTLLTEIRESESQIRIDKCITMGFYNTPIVLAPGMRLSTIIRRLSHKLFRELLPFVKLYSGNIVSRNVLILGIPSPFVIVLTLWSLLLGPGAVPTDTTLSNRGAFGSGFRTAAGLQRGCFGGGDWVVSGWVVRLAVAKLGVRLVETAGTAGGKRCVGVVGIAQMGILGLVVGLAAGKRLLLGGQPGLPRGTTTT